MSKIIHVQGMQETGLKWGDKETGMPIMTGKFVDHPKKASGVEWHFVLTPNDEGIAGIVINGGKDAGFYVVEPV